MRCIACDVALNDFESTRKDEHGAYIDMCSKCFSYIETDVPCSIREDLISEADTIEDDE